MAGTDSNGADENEAPLLSVEDLRTHIRTDRGTIHAVDGVNFEVDRGETVCIVGESGSGKSVTCESLTGIVPQPPAEIVGGTVEFDGTSLVDGDESLLREVRGDRVAHVFQNPQQALDPVYSVGDQIAEAVAVHRDVSDERARRRGIELLDRVGIPDAATRIDDYPHQFSGGMAQRVAIAIALAADPDLLIADEPTTAVDVTVQARLIDLFRELTDDDSALLLVTHDLRVVAALADRVLVMYGGTVVERGPVEALYDRPAHPYTQALFDSHGDRSRSGDRTARDDIPTSGCRFREECPHAVDACAAPEKPEFRPVDGSDSHAAACVHYGPDGESDRVLNDARSLSGGNDE